MSTWLLTLHGPDGSLGSVETGETQFVMGTETAADVYTVAGSGVASRHAWLWISEAGLQVEPLGGETLVNGHAITERVQVGFPSSVQAGEITLTVELQAARVEEATLLAETIPVARVQPSKPASSVHDIAITIPTKAAKTAKPQTPAEDPALAETILATKSRTVPRARHVTDKPDFQEAPLQGAYRLVKEIARGGMGQIHLGDDPQLERQVAVKVSSLAHGGEDPRFEKEAKVLAQLAHPNIVPIYTRGTDAQGRPFYSMKLIKGRTLQAVLDAIREGDTAAVHEYPRAALLTIFRKVCDALAFAHSKRILHRDLKPENVMVGEYGEVLVMDWGLAKVLGEVEENTRAARALDTGDYGMTLEGEVMGTPQYMSPEQAQGMVSGLDARSDIYSLGGILYAILTLRPPVEGKTLQEVLTKVKNGSLSSMQVPRAHPDGGPAGNPSTMGMTVPEALQAVTLKAMATDREKRYARVEDLAADIEAYQNGFATSAENAGALRQIILFVKRNRGLSAAAAILVLAACLFTVRLSQSEKSARASERRAVTAMEKSRQETALTALTFAEASEQAGDFESMQRALGSIPEDLRDSTWRYLSSRVDFSDRQILPPPGTSWVGLENHPSDPRLFVVLTSGGTFGSLDPATGEISPLWKMELQGRKADRFAISGDGVRVAVAFKALKENQPFDVEVFEFRSGQKLGVTFPFPHGVSDMQVSEKSVAAGWFSAPGRPSRFVCWDFETGQERWQRGGINNVCFLKKDRAVLGIFGATLLRLEPDSGADLVEQATVEQQLTHWQRPSNSVFAEAANAVFGAGNRRIASIKIHDNHLRFSALVDGEVFALGFSPAKKWLACVVSKGPSMAALELRNSDNGDLLRSFPLRARMIGWLDAMTSVRLSSECVAVRINGDPRIRIWNLSETPKVHGTFLAKNSPAAAWVGEGDEALVLSKTKPEPGKHDTFQLERVDIRKARNSSVPSPLMTVSDRSLFSMDLAGRAAGDWVLYGWGSGRYAASVGAQAAREVWQIKAKSHRSVTLHPTQDEVWVAGSLVDLATGHETRSIPRTGLVSKRLLRPETHWAVWAGEDRVVEPVQSGVNEGGPDAPPPPSKLALWNVRTGTLEACVDAPAVTLVASSPDGKHVLEGGEDRRVRIRNGRTLEVESEARVHDLRVTGAVWHPSKPLVVTASRDGTLRVWNWTEWRLVEEVRIEHGRSWDVQISPSGRRLLVWDFQNDLRVYEPGCFQE